MNNKKSNMRVTWEYPGGQVYTLHSIQSIVVESDRVVISFSYHNTLELSRSSIAYITKIEEYEEETRC